MKLGYKKSILCNLMSKQNKNQQKQQNKYPFVSICTPTYNRRPFIPYIIKCFQQQTYPKERMEWIIIDDGTDKIEDLVKDIPQIKYFKYDEKLTLGKKRNISHEKSSGDIIVYMDDDDYYPAERVSHAVETLQKNPTILCVGSSEMHIYFKHIHKMYKFGPYAPNHSTAATLAFRKELLKDTKFDETACLAEEKMFLKNYTIPMIQLDTMKSILVFSHIHNSFDKKTLLVNAPNPRVTESIKKPSEFVKDADILKYFMEDIDNVLEIYEPGKPENKLDVIIQMEKLKMEREAKIKEHQQNQQTQHFVKTLNELTNENKQLKDKVVYLENKIRQIISAKIQEKIAAI